MAVFTPGDSSTGLDATGNDDIWITQPRDLVTNTGYGFSFASFTGVSYIVQGSVFADDDSSESEGGWGVYANTEDNALYVQDTGTVWGEATGVRLTPNADRFNLVNEGSITGAKGPGLRSAAVDVTVENLGTIEGDANGIVAANGSDNMLVVNTGTILGRGDHGINNAALDIEIINAGTITGATDGVFSSGSGAHTLLNTGSILGGNTGVDASTGASGSFLIRNSGTIGGSAADGQSIEGGAGTETVINTGVLIGDVRLRGGADVFDNRGGEIASSVFGGAGDDTYIVDDSFISLVEVAGEGTDEVQTTAGFALAENFENLTLLGAADIDGTGNAEDNVISGNAGENKLRGGNGEDELFGFGGDDILRGAGDADRLRGGDGDDVLRGGGGNDKLYGDDGDDVLTGGADIDDFYFFDRGGADVITDFDAFNNSEDIVLKNLSEITDFADLVANHMTQVGDDVLIDALNGDTITVRNVQLADMNSGDFVF